MATVMILSIIQLQEIVTTCHMIQLSWRKKQITLQVQENKKTTITREFLWPSVLLQMITQGVQHTAIGKQHY